MKIFLIIAGLVVGMLFGLRKQQSIVKIIATLVFSFLLPYIVVVEVSSMDIGEWYMFAWGSAFVFVLFYLGRTFADKNKAALLATAEGGTLGFVLYNLIGTEPLSRFFLVDMLGNGAILFSFIYWQVGHEFKLKSFFKNPLMIAMFAGVIINLLGIHLLKISVINSVEPILSITLTLLVCVVVGSDIKFNVSREIFFSKFYWGYWGIRTIGAVSCVWLKLPLALTVLFVLPPSFLLPVMYRDGGEKKVYASNFVAATLPISLALAILLTIFM
jgi:hypothetical protein